MSDENRAGPALGKGLSATSRFAPTERAEIGRFEGIFRVEGWTLRREDGLSLVVCYNSRPLGPRHSDRFLVEASAPGRPRVGFLYGTSPSIDGREFDDRVYRYRVERVDAEHIRIRTLYRKGQERGGR